MVGAAIGANSVPMQAFEAARRRDQLALSRAVFDEIVEVMHRPKLARYVDPVLRARLLADLSVAAVWFAPLEAVRDCRDPKDDKVLELALAAGAGIIIASDADLLALTPWRGVRILRPAAYVGMALS